MTAPLLPATRPSATRASLRPAGRSGVRAARGLAALLAWVACRCAGDPPAPAPGTAPPSGPGPVLELPPMFVTESFAGAGWRHGSLPGFEILSQCTDFTTEAFALEFNRCQLALREFAPLDLQGRFDVPATMILMRRSSLSRLSRELNDALQSGGGRAARETPHDFRPIPQFRVSDEDSYGFLFILDDHGTDTYAGVQLTRSYIGFLLDQRRPAPPPWFEYGAEILYEYTRYTDPGLALPSSVWMSEDETSALRRDPLHPRVFLPLREFFSGPPNPKAGPDGVARLAAWESEAMLLARWAFEGKGHPRRAKWWDLARRSGPGPVDEAAFRDEFGLDFDDARDRLSDDLAAEVNPHSTLRLDFRPPDPRINLRDATALELDRLQADLECKEVSLVEAEHPELVAVYRRRAEATLQAAFARGSNDPALLAAAGLLAADAGEAPRAAPLLEEATAAGVLRPAAYVELARIRAREAQAHPAGPSGHWDDAQVAAVLAPLRIARTQHPQLLRGYWIAADAWMHASGSPGAADAAWLGEGVSLYPEQGNFALTCAAVLARAGFTAQAAGALDLALQARPRPELRTRISDARAALGPASTRP